MITDKVKIVIVILMMHSGIMLQSMEITTFINSVEVDAIQKPDIIVSTKQPLKKDSALRILKPEFKVIIFSRYKHTFDPRLEPRSIGGNMHVIETY